jgi:branched-subunit amino acid transport protein
VTHYSTVTLWLVILVIGIGTFALRFSLIALSDRADRLPESVQRALRFIPPAAFAAIAAPAFLVPAGSIDVTFGNLRLIAGLVASAVAWKTRSVLWTILSGMVVLWLLQAIAG